MPVIISMLRGVNVGSHNKVKMDALRALYESLGLRDPQTYVQSGNAIFRTEERDLDRLARRIESAIEKALGFHSDVILRTSSELRAVIAKNPFATWRGMEPNKLLITFLAGDPVPEAGEKIRTFKADPEEVRIAGRELYIYFPNGIGQSKLSMPTVLKTLKTSGTGRNWNSITKMLEIAARLEGIYLLAGINRC
jgi:uncharacterized protein (DUF1697 family)